MVDLALSTTAGATDADVVFEPIDREAQPTEHNEIVPGWSSRPCCGAYHGAAEEAAAIAGPWHVGGGERSLTIRS